MSQTIRNNVRAIIIQNNKLLTICLKDGDDEYYILPGGKIEFGETAQEGLRREMQEEIGCDIEAGACVFIREFIGARRKEVMGSVSDKHFLELYFKANLLGEPDLQVREEHQKHIRWLPLDHVAGAVLKPEFLKKALLDPEFHEKSIYLGDVD